MNAKALKIIDGDRKDKYSTDNTCVEVQIPGDFTDSQKELVMVFAWVIKNPYAYESLKREVEIIVDALKRQGLVFGKVDGNGNTHHPELEDFIQALRTNSAIRTAFLGEYNLRVKPYLTQVSSSG